MSDDVIEEDGESHLAQYFPQCPLCGSESLKFDIEYGNVQDYIYCLSCKSKWEIGWKGENFEVESITLVETADPEKSALKGVKHTPEFWRTMASQAKETPPIASQAQPIEKEKDVIVEKEVIVKVKCPYCGGLYDEVLDTCPQCGAKR
jgi:Zn finger protein HypA/HybF involved in hydrogenase expression